MGGRAATTEAVAIALKVDTLSAGDVWGLGLGVGNGVSPLELSLERPQCIGRILRQSNCKGKKDLFSNYPTRNIDVEV